VNGKGGLEEEEEKERKKGRNKVTVRIIFVYSFTSHGILDQPQFREDERGKREKEKSRRNGVIS